MSFPALLGYYNPPNDALPASVDLYRLPDGANRFYLHDEIDSLSHDKTGYELPDLSTFDKSPIDDIREAGYEEANGAVKRNVPLETLGDIIDYYDTFALYLKTPSELYTYVTIPMWPDIMPLWVHGLDAAVYESNPIKADKPPRRDMVPEFRFDDDTYRTPIEPETHPFELIRSSTRDIFNSAKNLLNDDNFTHNDESPGIVSRKLPNGNYLAAVIRDPELFENMNTGGILLRVDGGGPDTVPPSVAAEKAASETTRLRTLYAQHVWAEHLKLTRQQQAGIGEDETPANPQAVAQNQAYTFTLDLLEKFGRSISPLSNSLYAEEIISRTDSTATDFVGQSTPEIDGEHPVLE